MSYSRESIPPHPHSPWNFRELSSLGQSAGVKTSPGLDACSLTLWLWPPLPQRGKNKDLHMCSSVWGRKEENLPLYLHAEAASQREKMNGGSLPYLPDRPSSFFPSGLTGGASPPRSGAWRAGSSPAPTQLPGRHCAAVPVRCHGNWQPY